MEIIKFDRIVSVSNEIQGHGAANILEGEIRPKKNWMCEKGTEKGTLILQLERAAVLASIHIGNAHSAFVEVLVGTAAKGSDDFESLIPMSTFMNPQESKTSTNPNRTRFFNKEDFNESTAGKTWDRIKVVCTQPFNRHVPYGLCFLKVHGDKEVKKTEAVTQKDEEGEEIQIGSFFKKKRSSGGDKPLTVSEQIKKADRESDQHTPLNVAKVAAKMNEKQSSEKKPKIVVTSSEEKRGEKRKNKEEMKEVRKSPKKKKEEARVDRSPKKRKKRKKAFEKLMEDVVLVISGFQNPLRGNIRSKALAMGAKYSADWASHCTHLVCAYENTPKFNQVKGKGKIVKKDWVEKCHEDRKRYPWRRFALSKTDSKNPESEEEIEAGDESEPEVEQSPKPGTSKETEGEKDNEKKANTSADEYDAATDEEKEESSVDTTDYPMPHLPNLFSSKKFYVDPNLRNKAKVERYIVAYDGIVAETFDEGVEFLVTEKGGAPFEMFRRKASHLVAIRPSWIWEVNAEARCTPTTPHLVN